jgi:hypothetical protein
MKRKHIPLKVQLAAELLDRRDHTTGRPLIPYEDSKQMTADQIISLFQIDHYPIRHADGGPDEPWNLRWRWVGEHREKTKRDVAEMAKSKRLREGRKRRGRPIPSRPFPKGRKFKR